MSHTRFGAGPLALTLVTVGALALACNDDPAAPMPPEPARDAPAAMDPFVGVLIGSLENPETARSARDWLVAATQRPGRDARLEVEATPAWSLEPTTPNDFITLDALRLVLGVEPAEAEATHPKEREP
jgi:hypothetical protein